mmetsp:Transcript_48668/g.121530  ORF Transcript_48668/g.121530 Transcript_48668/m.121530 type:complete len:103 (+) Transcript_48668:1019-1327(+)
MGCSTPESPLKALLEASRKQAGWWGSDSGAADIKSSPSCASEGAEECEMLLHEGAAEWRGVEAMEAEEEQGGEEGLGEAENSAVPPDEVEEGVGAEEEEESA